MVLFIFFIGAYIVGSIPFSYITAKLFKGIDIREHGSGNPGATNVFRVLGPIPGITAFTFDILKGFLPVLFAVQYFGTENLKFSILVGLAAIVGHVYTVFLKFKGGKGVATATGVFLALLPINTLIGIAIFTIMFAITKYVSTSSIIAGISFAILSWVTKQDPIISVFATLVAVLIIYTHRSNIKRLISGKENKIVEKKSTTGKNYPKGQNK
ncbi:glycerol-3-phosphate 1-O-acyltransferase PlsY [Elusimicrobiota bacterium]